jgi:hypothetical protein
LKASIIDIQTIAAVPHPPQAIQSAPSLSNPLAGDATCYFAYWAMMERPLMARHWGKAFRSLMSLPACPRERR